MGNVLRYVLWYSPRDTLYIDELGDDGEDYNDRFKTSPQAPQRLDNKRQEPASLLTRPLPSESPPENDVCIVGYGCRTAGADNIREFWKLLVNGECHVTDIPPDRWNAKAYYDPNPMAHGKAYVQKGGFVNDCHGFDNALYGINDMEAGEMDPQQKFLLDCTIMALEKAGITRAQINGSNTGVYIGAMNSDSRSSAIGLSSRINSYTATSKSLSFMSARVSYVFNLLGPSMVVDAACSAALISVHLACQALLSGEIDMAICGGVNSMTLPDAYIHLSKAKMISPTGLCHTFSDKADGYIRGEGCGVVILKRLRDAIRDNDNICCTVCTGTNQDGHTVSPMTAPSGEQQKKLLHHVYGKFGIDVNKVRYMEAHGTGTPAGDPVEVNALGEFLKESGKEGETYIGSVKTNIGHTEPAAGVVGLIKILLMMDHDIIVPSLHCDVVNPKIDLEGLNVRIPKQRVKWPGREKAAGCNSFGFGGSNCHAVVQSHVKRPGASKPKRRNKPCVVCLSGNTKRSLAGSLKDLHEDSETAVLDVHDVSYTSTRRRDHYPYRAAFVVSDMQDLVARVGEFLAADGVSSCSLAKHRDVVFVFCGMGTAWRGMCEELMEENPVFRKAMKEVDDHLSDYVDWSLVERLEQGEDPTQDPIFEPIAVFACQVALASVWKSLGVKPARVVGQSIGEVAAAYTAEALSLADAVQVIYHRSRLLAEVSGGCMLVVQNVEVGKVRKLLQDTEGKATISLQYSPNSCAVSADAETMSSLRQTLQAELRGENQNLQLIDLDVSVAYHSQYVDPCIGPLMDALQDLEAVKPKVPFISAVNGAKRASAPDAQYWVDNMRKPVLFGDAMLEAVPENERGSVCILEIGPKPVLRSHMRDLFPEQSVTALPSMSKGSEVKCFLHSVAALYKEGVDVKWENLPTQGDTTTDIPRYSFDKKSTVKASEIEVLLKNSIDFFRQGHLYTCPIRDCLTHFRLILSPFTIASVYEHVVSGMIVVPGMLYAEAGFAVAKYVGLGPSVTVSVEFQNPALVKKDEVTDFDIHFESDTSPGELCSSPLVVQKDNKQHAKIWLTRSQAGPQEVMNVDHIRSRCDGEITKVAIYSALRQFGFEYGESFSLLEHAWMNSTECLATVRLNSTVCREMTATIFHPCIMDSMMQSTVFLAIQRGTSEGNILPQSVGKIEVYSLMEPTMFIHSQLKSEGHNACVFDQRLLSCTGHVIAELSDFTVKSLKPTDENEQPMLITEWEMMTELKMDEVVRGSDDNEGSKMIFITDDDSTNENHGSVVMHYDETNIESMSDKIDGVLHTHKDASAVVFIYTGEITQEDKGCAVQEHLTSLCCLVQTVLNHLVNNHLSIPVYLCTFRAWPADNGDQKPVSPSAAALWGLMRSVILEHVYPRTTLVDLHLPKDRPRSLHSLIGFLLKEEFHSYPELLISEDRIFYGQISKLNDVTIPQSRPTYMGKSRRTDRRAVIVSQTSTAISKPLAVDIACTAESASPQGMKLQVHSFVRPPSDLLDMRLSSDTVLSEDLPLQAFVVMALEVVGRETDGSDDEVASCCPMALGFEVSVSADTTVPTSVIPSYQAGDLTKLVLLWELHTKASNQAVTILASQATLHLAKVLQLFCIINTEIDAKNISIVTLEDLGKAACLHECLLSVVLLDSGVMSAVTKTWKNAKLLVSVSSLLSSEARSQLSFTKPEAEVCLLDTNQLCTPQYLKKVVPSVRAFAEKHKAQMPEVSEALHTEAAEGAVCDLNRLLSLQSQAMDSLQCSDFQSKLFRKDSAYVVVGGLTGLGWICVEFLAQNDAGYIGIINRRTPSPEQREKMETVSTSTRCQIQAFQADVSSMESLADALERIKKSASAFTLRGIFMGAGVLNDGLFSTMGRPAFERVLSPKVQGAWNLHQLTKHLPLDYFVMHSSVTAVLGNAGQANYGAGNAFLDGLAHYRRQKGLAGQSINWGPLDTGMLDKQDALKKKIEATGFRVSTKQEIQETLKAMLLLNWTQSIPVKINTDLYTKKVLELGNRLVSKRFQKLVSPAAVTSTTADERFLDAGRIRFLEPEERFQAYQKYVRKLAASLTAVEAERITNSVNLLDLGLDSITVTAMISQIHQDTSFTLTAVDVLVGEVTVTSIARLLDDLASNSK